MLLYELCNANYQLIMTIIFQIIIRNPTYIWANNQAVRDNTGERKIYENHVNKTTEDWLKVYGLEAQKLTLADFTREKERL